MTAARSLSDALTVILLSGSNMESCSDASSIRCLTMFQEAVTRVRPIIVDAIVMTLTLPILALVASMTHIAMSVDGLSDICKWLLLFESGFGVLILFTFGVHTTGLLIIDAWFGLRGAWRQRSHISSSAQ